MRVSASSSGADGPRGCVSPASGPGSVATHRLRRAARGRRGDGGVARRRLPDSATISLTLKRTRRGGRGRMERETAAEADGGRGGGVRWVRRSRRPASGEWERLEKCCWLLAGGGWVDCSRLAPIDRQKLMTNNQDFECNPSLCRQRHATRAEYLRRRHDRSEGDYR